MIEVARFIWWMAAAALVVPFLLGGNPFGTGRWITRATTQRALLGVAEVGSIVAWLFVRDRWRFLPEQEGGVAFAGAMLAFTGALLVAWARASLGRLFSPQLGVQQDHELITTGPYGVVRHPIYLGAIDFTLGSALFWNDMALVGVAAVLTVCFAAQLRIEERLFAAHFGEAWEEYRKAVPALFPRIWPRG